MKRQTITLVTSGLLMCQCMWGQIAIKPEAYYNGATGVSNEGIVCGYSKYREPYELWNSVTNKIEVIGGTGPGDGIGGRAMFSSDGKTLCGTSETTVPIPQEWQRKVFHEPLLLKKVLVRSAKGNIVGKSAAADGDGICMSSADRNRIWIESYASSSATPVGGVNSISAAANSLFIAGEKALAKKIASGSWAAMTPVSENVSSYLSIDFYDDSKGVAGALLRNSEYAVYSTLDAGASWVKATGLSGTIVDINHIGATYYLVTKEGKIWQSDNYGENWSELATVANTPRRIKFYDENTGVITAIGAVYFTEDKGVNWKSVEIAEGVTKQTTWNDLVWMSKEKMMIVGTKDVIYLSVDGGKTWKWENKEQSDGKTELLSVDADANYILVCGDNSTLYKKELAASMALHQMSKYNIEKKEWKQLGFLGGISDDTSGGGYCISGDGKTIAGFSYTMPDEYRIYRKKDNYKGYGHGVTWSEKEGFNDLGSLLDGSMKSTRCNAISDDGSVIVGYQETKYGDWVGAIWRKSLEGGYLANEYIPIDAEKGVSDPLNLIGECYTISGNGEWVGGKDTYFLGDSWIWSKDTGVIGLGMTDLPLYIDNSGELVIAQRNVWTKETGAISIQEYLLSLGIKLEDEGIERINMIQSVSKNGRYIAGLAVANGVGVTICIDLKYNETGIQDNMPSSKRISISQNPVADCLAVELPEGEAQLYLSDMQGRQIKAQSCTTDQAVIQVSDVPEGLYLLNVVTGKARETFKIQIRH